MIKLFYWLFLWLILLVILVGIFIFLCLLIEITLDIDLKKVFKKKVEKLKEYKNVKKIETQIKRKTKKSDSISVEALKFEYDKIYTIVSEVVKQESVEGFISNEIYLIKLHEYFTQINKIKPTSINTIEFLACLYKAIEDEPIFINISETESYNCYINSCFLEKLKERLKKENFNTFDGIEITSENQIDMMRYCSEKYIVYDNEIYFTARSIILHMYIN